MVKTLEYDFSEMERRIVQTEEPIVYSKDPKVRRIEKTVAFGIAYGMSKYRIDQVLSGSTREKK